MPIYMTARYKVHPHKVDQCKTTIAEFVEHIKSREPTTPFYLALQEITDPTSFFHAMVFENEAAIKTHQNSEATKRFVDMVYPSAIQPLEFKEYNVLGFKGK